MPENIQFACGSSGHPDYCPSQCGFGKFCKFLKNQSVKPRGMGESAKIVPTPAKKEEPKPKVEMYY